MNNTKDYYPSIPDVLTVKQLQQILCIGRKAAYDLVRSGDIPHLKIGKSIRIPKRGFLDFLEKPCYNPPIATNRLP